MGRYWVTMAPDYPAMGRVVIVDADSSHEANMKVHRLGLVKPGDESILYLIPTNAPEFELPLNRELTTEELRSVGARTTQEIVAEMIRIHRQSRERKN